MNKKTKQQKTTELTCENLCPSETNESNPLSERLRDGDPDAFQTIYMQWFLPINYFLRRITRDEQDAKDLTQDVFCTLWVQRERIDPQKDIRGLIFTIARHRACDHIKKYVVRNKFLSSITPEEEGCDSTNEIVLAKELELLTEFVVEKMPPMRREVYLLSLDKGLTTAQIAEQLAISPRRVNDYLYEARQDIKKAIALVLCFLLTNITQVM